MYPTVQWWPSWGQPGRGWGHGQQTGLCSSVWWWPTPWLWSGGGGYCSLHIFCTLIRKAVPPPPNSLPEGGGLAPSCLSLIPHSYLAGLYPSFPPSPLPLVLWWGGGGVWSASKPWLNGYTPKPSPGVGQIKQEVMLKIPWMMLRIDFLLSFVFFSNILKRDRKGGNIY